MKKSLIVFALFYAGYTHAAGFDCKKASTKIEKTICADSTLFIQDGAMSKSYKNALTMPDCADALKADQKSWLKDVRNACEDAECLTKAYSDRIALLDGLAAHPGAGKDMTGTYSTPCWGLGTAGGELKIKKLAEDKAQFQLECNRGGPAFNRGMLDGTFVLSKQGTSSFVAPKPDPASGQCEIVFDFSQQGKVKLTQNGSDVDCGFGNAVICDGIYDLKSADAPEFTSH